MRLSPLSQVRSAITGKNRFPVTIRQIQLAAQQPSCHEQVPAGDIEDQTFGTGQIGRRYFADGYFAEDKPNPMSAVWDRSRMEPFSFGAYRPLTSPDLPDARVASA
jgi:hypothetical protein